jgi:PilX N-terminal
MRRHIVRFYRSSIGWYCLTAPCANSGGAALITALMFMTAMAALGPFLIQTTTVETAMSGNYLKSTQAMYAAEAGVNRLIRKYRNDPTLFTQAKNLADMALPEATPKTTNLSNQMAYWYTNLTYEASNPPQFVEFQSNGTTLGSTSLARISTRIIYDPPSPFDAALFGQEHLELNGQGSVDSYNACEAPYDPKKPGNNGDIGTNATGSGSILLNGNPALVRGNASVGVGGDPSNDIGGNGTLTGTKTTLKEPKQLTPKKAPTGSTFTHINLSGKQQETLTAGNYEVSDLYLSAKATLHIKGNVTIYVNSNMEITGQSQIVVYAGASLTFYVDKYANIAGNGIVNYNQLPSTLMIYGTANAEQIQIAGNGNFYGVVHAPTANVTIAGNGDLYGAAIGKTLSTNGNGAVHYDECLGKLVDTTVDPFRVVFWRLD